MFLNSKDALKALKEFFIYVQCNYTESNAQLLYYTLWQINNMTGWLDEFQSANTTLCAIMGISEKPLIKNRNILKQLGFISFKHSKSRRSKTTYKILYPTIHTKSVICTGATPVQTPVQSPVQTPAQSPDLYIHNTNTYTISLSKPLSHTEGYLQTPKKEPDQSMWMREIDERDEIAQKFSEKIKPITRADRDQLNELKERYSKAQILAAIERAAGTGYSVGYIRAILVNSNVNKQESMNVIAEMERKPSYDIEAYERHCIFDEEVQYPEPDD